MKTDETFEYCREIFDGLMDQCIAIDDLLEESETNSLPEDTRKSLKRLKSKTKELADRTLQEFWRVE